MAIREAIRYWRFWLIGRKFTVITDHRPLHGLKLKARTDEELGDLANELAQFDFEVIYRPGVSNCEADCLSRNPVLEGDEKDGFERIIPTLNFLSLDEIRTSQKLISRVPSDIIRSGVILRNINRNHRIVLDPVYGEKLAQSLHSQLGHIGEKQLSLMIRKYFTFPNYSDCIHRLCRECEICIKNKSRRPTPSGGLGHFGPSSNPYNIMSLDTVGGLGNKSSAKRYCHLLVDHFTRYAYASYTKGQSAKEMIKLVDSVHRVNPIGTLLTDQYGGLSSQEFQDYCEGAGINHIFVAVDSAFSNGLNERQPNIGKPYTLQLQHSWS